MAGANKLERFEVRNYTSDWFEIVCRIVQGRIVEAALRLKQEPSLVTIFAPGPNHWVAEGEIASVNTGTP